MQDRHGYNWISPLAALMMLLALIIVVQPDEDESTSMPPDVLDERVTGLMPVGGDRSSHWPTVREEFAIEHPECEACGTRDDLNVHHVIPFHEHPELELDKANLITLCREHHFRIGHDPDGLAGPQKPNWKKSNPYVREEAAAFKAADRSR